MGPAVTVRLQRLTDERQRSEAMVADIYSAAEGDGGRDLTESETEQAERHRSRLADLDVEIEAIAGDLEREKRTRDVSAMIRGADDTVDPGSGPVVYRTFGTYARDAMLARYEQLAAMVEGPDAVSRIQEHARENLQRAVVDTTSSDVGGLIPPQHMAQILDIIDRSRPIVASARSVDLSRGKLTYPKIAQRPEVLKQSQEKTEAGTANMQVSLEEMNADTYLGGGDLSWQTINWSSPDALQLWFDLAAEAYARQTEVAAASELSGTAVGTVSPALGTAGTEDFGAWRAGVLAGIAGIYSTTGGRAKADTLYVSAARFFQLAGLGTADVVQLSAIGNLDIGTMTGTFFGLKVVGSYGLTGNATILGDSSAFLVGETPGAPVQLRAVEPTIAGMEVGVVGAFAAKVFDPDRFIKLNA